MNAHLWKERAVCALDRKSDTTNFHSQITQSDKSADTEFLEKCRIPLEQNFHSSVVYSLICLR